MGGFGQGGFGQGPFGGGAAGALTFPDLGVQPDPESFAVDPIDNTFRSQFSDGYEESRQDGRVRTEFTATFKFVSGTNKNAFDAWVKNTVFVGAMPFLWVNPADGIAYTVRFAESPKSRYLGYDGDYLWQISVRMREV